MIYWASNVRTIARRAPCERKNVLASVQVCSAGNGWRIREFFRNSRNIVVFYCHNGFNSRKDWRSGNISARQPEFRCR